MNLRLQVSRFQDCARVLGHTNPLSMRILCKTKQILAKKSKKTPEKKILLIILCTNSDRPNVHNFFPIASSVDYLHLIFYSDISHLTHSLLDLQEPLKHDRRPLCLDLRQVLPLLGVHYQVE